MTRSIGNGSNQRDSKPSCKGVANFLASLFAEGYQYNSIISTDL